MRLAALVSRHRRLLAATGAAAAVAFALSAPRSAAPHGVQVPTAAGDLPSGATLRAADVRSVTVPDAAVPAGIVWSGLVGRVLAGPIRRGEPLTDTRLIGRRLLSGYGAGLVAVPVRMADAGSARLLRPGDRIDVLAAAAAFGDPAGDEATDPAVRRLVRAHPLISAVPVIAVPGGAGGYESGGAGLGDAPSDDPGATGDATGDGGLVVVAARRDQADTLVGSAAGARLSFVIVG